MQLSWILAVFLAALASFISNLGVNLQKLHHIRARGSSPSSSSSSPLTSITSSSSSHSSTSPPPLPTAHYSASLLWRLGLLLIVFGSLFDVAALGLGAQSLVAPLGSLTLVSNILCAYLLLKERVTRYDILCTSLIITGSTFAVAFGKKEELTFSIDELFSFFHRPAFIVYATLVIVFSIACYMQIHRLERLEAEEGKGSLLYLRHRSLHRFLYPALAGTIGAQSVLFAKCSVELLNNTLNPPTPTSPSMFRRWQSYLVLACMFTSIFLQIKYLNEGLRRFSSTYSIPVFQAFWILISVVSGLIFYREYEGFEPLDAALFSLGVVVTVVGVVMLSGRDTEDHHHQHREGHVQVGDQMMKLGDEGGTEDGLGAGSDDELELGGMSEGDSDDESGGSEGDEEVEMSVLYINSNGVGGGGGGGGGVGGGGGGGAGGGGGSGVGGGEGMVKREGLGVVVEALKDKINGHMNGAKGLGEISRPSSDEEEKKEVAPLIPSRTSSASQVSPRNTTPQSKGKAK